MLELYKAMKAQEVSSPIVVRDWESQLQGLKYLRRRGLVRLIYKFHKEREFKLSEIRVMNCEVIALCI